MGLRGGFTRVGLLTRDLLRFPGMWLDSPIYRGIGVAWLPFDLVRTCMVATIIAGQTMTPEFGPCNLVGLCTVPLGVNRGVRGLVQGSGICWFRPSETWWRGYAEYAENM